MKALTLTQPWATLVALGVKTIETRSWSTSYRGPLAIHAATSFPAWARGFARTTARRDLYAMARELDGDIFDPKVLPRGAVLCAVRLMDVVSTSEPGFDRFYTGEVEYGDYSPGRFAWYLSHLHRLPDPIPAKGALGLWEWTPRAEVRL